MSERPVILQPQHRIARLRGFTLIELMVAMLLGLIVTAGVVSVFLAGQQTYRTNEALGDVENGSRTAFELLARDLRGAGLTGCDNTNGRIADVINGTAWYSNWNNAVHGYDDASTDPALTGITAATGGVPVAGQSSVQIISTANTDITVVKTPGGNSATFEINAGTTELTTGDLIMVCDFDHATMMQISNYQNSSTVSVEHNTGKGTPGNCSKGLGYPTDCSSTTGNFYPFGANSRVAKLTAVDWYIGTNLLGGKSLYRVAVVNSSGTPTPTPQEMVRNVTSMKIKYLQPPGTGFTTATSVTNWAVVDAAQIVLTLISTNQRASTNTAPLTRNFTSTTTVRNRVQ